MVDKVEIPASGDGPTLEAQAAAQEAAAAAAAAAQSDPALAGEEGTGDRPEWLPEKFKSVEDMAKAYAELEKAQSQGGEGDDDDDDDGDVEGAVAEAGLDMDALSTEWAENGELTAESYEALEAIGITRDMVDAYARGVEAEASEATAEMLEPLGGDVEIYNDLVEWAADNLEDAQIDEFNGILETGNAAAIKMAVKSLAEAFEASEGSEPAFQLNGTAAATSGSRYESTQDLMKDMQNPEYASNPAFRAKVEAKLARSSIL